MLRDHVAMFEAFTGSVPRIVSDGGSARGYLDHRRAAPASIHLVAGAQGGLQCGAVPEMPEVQGQRVRS